MKTLLFLRPNPEKGKHHKRQLILGLRHYSRAVTVGQTWMKRQQQTLFKE
jgi:hypothetical protein